MRGWGVVLNTGSCDQINLHISGLVGMEETQMRVNCLKWSKDTYAATCSLLLGGKPCPSAGPWCCQVFLSFTRLFRGSGSAWITYIVIILYIYRSSISALIALLAEKHNQAAIGSPKAHNGLPGGPSASWGESCWVWYARTEEWETIASNNSRLQTQVNHWKELL